jgi:bifunctional isochorismate lyase/aryl carrier protein
VSIAAIAPYEIPLPETWPAARAGWTIDPARCALLIHDVQAYFVEPFDSAAPPLRGALEHMTQLRAACERASVPVFFSAQPGEQSREERGLLWDVWGAGIVSAPQLSRFTDALTPGPQDQVIAKRRYSAFYETALAGALRERGRDQLLITGVYGHIGCLATATDAFMRGVQPFLVGDAIADFSAEDHAAAVRLVARTCGVVTTAHAALHALYRRAIRSELERVLAAPIDDLKDGDDVGDAGVDSIRWMELIEVVLPAGQRVAFEELAAARTIDALVVLLARPALSERRSAGAAA